MTLNFCQAETQEVMNMKRVLSCFEILSSLHIYHSFPCNFCHMISRLALGQPFFFVLGFRAAYDCGHGDAVVHNTLQPCRAAQNDVVLAANGTPH